MWQAQLPKQSTIGSIPCIQEKNNENKLYTKTVWTEG